MKLLQHQGVGKQKKPKEHENLSNQRVTRNQRVTAAESDWIGLSSHSLDQIWMLMVTSMAMHPIMGHCSFHHV